MNRSGFLEDMESARRVILQAGPEKRCDVFRLICSEYMRWATVGGVEKATVIDALRAVGLEAGLDEKQIETALAEGVEHPFDPNDSHASVLSKKLALNTSAELVVKRAADIRPEPIRWLWPGRMAIGKQTILAGEPGLGKSQLTCWIAAAVSTRGSWPGGIDQAPLGSVIILSAEDDAADTICPRLDAAGADPKKVYIVSAVRMEHRKSRRSFNLQSDLQLLEHLVALIGDVRLVVIDPVSSYLGQVDSHRNAEVRAVLEPIGEMASRFGTVTVPFFLYACPGRKSAAHFSWARLPTGWMSSVVCGSPPVGVSTWMTRLRLS